MEKTESLPVKLMALIALIQGLCLLYLHQAIELDYWPNQQPQWLFAFYSLALIWPTLLLLSLTPDNGRRVVIMSLPFAVLSALLGYYVGYQATPLESVSFIPVLIGFVITMLIASFKALIYSQQLASSEQITYPVLFLRSWRNFLTFGLALFFAQTFWGILMLWGALFSAINIHFFQDLFLERWFFYPAIALANGFGVVIFRSHAGIIDTIARLLQALMKFLLLLLVLVSILFLGALVFTGLEPLWDSGGSRLILVMQALMLFFLNAVYQDEPEKWPYSLWLHRFIYFGVALLPIYSMISFYGLSLRVDQYGWSLSRCWGFLIWFLLALFPLGYWWGIARWRDDWVHSLSKVNVALGLVVMACMLLVNSPVLDFRKISVASQLDRLADNRVSLEDLDINYFRYDLARPGYEALQDIKQQYGSNNPNLLLRIEALYSNAETLPVEISQDDFIAAISQLTEDAPQNLLATIYEQYRDDIWSLQQNRNFYLRSLDLNSDGETEFLWVERGEGWNNLRLYYWQDESWKSSPIAYQYWDETEADRFYQALLAGQVEVEDPRWKDLFIGGIRLRIDAGN